MDMAVGGERGHGRSVAQARPRRPDGRSADASSGRRVIGSPARPKSSKTDFPSWPSAPTACGRHTDRVESAARSTTHPSSSGFSAARRRKIAVIGAPRSPARAPRWEGWPRRRAARAASRRRRRGRASRGSPGVRPGASRGTARARGPGNADSAIRPPPPCRRFRAAERARGSPLPGRCGASPVRQTAVDGDIEEHLGDGEARSLATITSGSWLVVGESGRRSGLAVTPMLTRPPARVAVRSRSGSVVVADIAGELRSAPPRAKERVHV